MRGHKQLPRVTSIHQICKARSWHIYGKFRPSRCFALSKTEEGCGHSRPLDIERIRLECARVPVPEAGSTMSDEHTHFPMTSDSFPAPPQSVMSVFSVPHGCSPAMAGKALEAMMDDALAETGVVLIRNLPIETTADVAEMVEAAVAADASRSPRRWKHMPHEPFGAPRSVQDGIPLATNIPGGQLLACHNESIYNPICPGRIGLVCVEPAAEGGESLILLNSDLTATTPPELLQFLKDHGGIRYTRYYHDRTRCERPAVSFMSWQDRCKLEDSATQKDAEEYWKRAGFSDKHLSWREDGTLVVDNVSTGFTPVRGSDVNSNFLGGYTEYCSPETLARALDDPAVAVSADCEQTAGRDIFTVLRNVPPGTFKAADGADFPKSLLEQHEETGWKACYAFKLQKGDFLMMDNLHVQHGRMPYKESNGRKRTVMTLLYE